MLNKIILLVFLLPYLYGCNSTKDKEKQPVNIETISIDSKSNLINDWSEFIQEITYVPLETNPESYIGTIDKILTKKDKLYIWDRQQKKIFVFNKTGKFLFKLDKLGRGKGEYRNIRDFQISENGEIYILDYMKIIQYDNKGNFVQILKLKSFTKESKASPLQFGIAKKNGWFFWIGSQSDFTKTPALYNVDKDFNVLWSDFRKGKNNPDYHRFYDNLNNYYFTENFGNDTIYEISNYGAIPKYFIDFGDKRITPANVNSSHSFLVNQGLCYRVYNTLNTSDHLFFMHAVEGRLRQVFYNKKNKQKRYGSTIFPLPNAPGRIMNVIDDCFIGIILPSSYHKDDKKGTDEIDQVFEGIDTNANPVLFFAKIKK